MTKEKSYDRVKSVLLIYGALLALAMLWLVTIFAAPALAAEGQPAAAALLYRSLSAICHQIPGRSFQYHGHPLAVCSRCTGMYAGFLLGLLVLPLFRALKDPRFPPREFLLLSAVPVSVDFLLGLAGLWQNTFFSRTLTGALFGFATAFYFFPGFVATFSEYRSQNRVRKNAVWNQ
jgi:uncharacterized membrane protein